MGPQESKQRPSVLDLPPRIPSRRFTLAVNFALRTSSSAQASASGNDSAAPSTRTQTDSDAHAQQPEEPGERPRSNSSPASTSLEPCQILRVQRRRSYLYRTIRTQAQAQARFQAQQQTPAWHSPACSSSGDADNETGDTTPSSTHSNSTPDEGNPLFSAMAANLLALITNPLAIRNRHGPFTTTRTIPSIHPGGRPRTVVTRCTMTSVVCRSPATSTGNDTTRNDTTGNDTTGNDTTGNDTTGNTTPTPAPDAGAESTADASDEASHVEDD
ncbi:uncharacterized protein B0H64DRAFT_458278 [Chaetomium fimeti]|uniref:Uncharacterized protein n=1 Tax=Chaetomium fimeti TaxID=1854472 RepID=A0AAE0LUA1_9PEZI|nr:hypothetical protein B0H64DRAFT_458278 [Chaetomium fimeti]